ncbi:E3 ubiquitin-protein ligase BRE1-like [Asbolus verrucosus]|uniref:E3 ubiquitin-protein ligase BRE1-like n=1 Tax=Asbolus verrucosus TaxID=1661398 RepID=A0A482VCX5_ASBVE|nr:E3 ubiquitin-protein ligase BRE1-like [Asbolus verrucosus]
MLSNVNSKIGNFMQSGNFISSDEDETEMIKAKTNKKPSPNPFFISDDSDDDCKFVKQPVGTSNFDISKPSTSAGTSSIPSKDNKPEVLDDDIMVLVDTVLDKKSSNSSQDKQSPMKDIKSLEEYRKETEEMLKNASCLLDEIKTGRKAETEDKKEESSQKVTVGLCPICLDSLADRPVSVTVCGHIFCKECILHTAQTLKKCPTCRKAINSKKIHPIYF